jgi:hypothetical protein
MRIINRAHLPWFIFVIIATVFASWLYVGNFAPQKLPAALQLPNSLLQKPSEHHRVGGTPLGLIFGTVALAIFVFAALLGVRKKVVLWRIGTVQRWLRAHIWLTLLTIPLVMLHSGFRLGGPMTTLIIVLYVVVMVSGIYGLILQHYLPTAMMERLPAESVYEQIPHIRAQLVAAATKMRDSFKPADRTDSPRGGPAPPKKPDAGAPAPSAEKSVTAGSAPMASTAAELSTPTARAKTVVGSTITAETVALPEKKPEEKTAPPTVPAAIPAEKPAAAVVAQPVAKSATPAAPAKAAPATDADSEAALLEFLDRQIIPYLSANRGDRLRLGNARFSEDTFRFVKLRVTEVYRDRVEEMQSWCDERRMLDLQLKLHHWLHAWLFVHAPISFLLLMLVFWHAFVTLFNY